MTDVLAVQAPAEAPKSKLAADVRKRLNGMADEYLEKVLKAGGSGGFMDAMKTIHSLGVADMKQAASVSNRILDRKTMPDEDGGVFGKTSESLVDLRRTVEGLDPTKTPARQLSVKVFGRRLKVPSLRKKAKDYVQQFQSGQVQIDAIIEALGHGQGELTKDNEVISKERKHLWSSMEKLQQYLYLVYRLEQRVAGEAEKLDRTDPGKGRKLREDVLFYVRQKGQDLLTQLAVSQQGYLALELIERSNMELIRGVDRAATTTVFALRTAVITDRALKTQRQVLEQQSHVTKTTGALIESTSELVRDQAAEIAQGASSATVDPAQVERAFRNVYTAMDQVDNFRLNAVTSMAQTVEGLAQAVGQAQKMLSERTDGPGDVKALPGYDVDAWIANEDAELKPKRRRKSHAKDDVA